MGLLNVVEKQLFFTSKLTSAWHRGVRNASLNTNLQSFDGPMALKGERPSLETAT